MSNLVKEIVQRLKANADPEVRRRSIKWEKHWVEEPKLHGLVAADVRKIAAEYYRAARTKSKAEFLALCEELLSTGYAEERTIAFDWAFRIRKQLESSDFKTLESWLTKHVNGWGSCDDLCAHALGAFVYTFPQFVARTKGWASSRNRWIRRACAVVMIYSIRRGRGLTDVFDVASLLLMDEDEMVQKGYGWMLKEASNRFPHEVFEYVMKNKHEMPRTALRYAIEKLPSNQKRKAMKKQISQSEI